MFFKDPAPSVLFDQIPGDGKAESVSATFCPEYSRKPATRWYANQINDLFQKFISESNLTNWIKPYRLLTLRMAVTVRLLYPFWKGWATWNGVNSVWKSRICRLRTLEKLLYSSTSRGESHPCLWSYTFTRIWISNTRSLWFMFYC